MLLSTAFLVRFEEWHTHFVLVDVVLLDAPQRLALLLSAVRDVFAGTCLSLGRDCFLQGVPWLPEVVRAVILGPILAHLDIHVRGRRRGRRRGRLRCRGGVAAGRMTLAHF